MIKDAKFICSFSSWFQNALEQLLEEQLFTKHKYVLVKYAQKAKTSASFKPTYEHLDRAVDWVRSIKRTVVVPKAEARGSCNFSFRLFIFACILCSILS